MADAREWLPGIGENGSCAYEDFVCWQDQCGVQRTAEGGLLLLQPANCGDGLRDQARSGAPLLREGKRLHNPTPGRCPGRTLFLER